MSESSLKIRVFIPLYGRSLSQSIPHFYIRWAFNSRRIKSSTILHTAFIGATSLFRGCVLR